MGCPSTRPPRADLPTIPAAMACRPIGQNGYPVPWFVCEDQRGEPDFRYSDAKKLLAAIAHDRCWVCGEPLGKHRAFLVGPAGAINRVTGEPPMHRECAEFSAKACPFLTRPAAERREDDAPADAVVDPTGQMLKHNPGVCVLWTVRAPGYRAFRRGAGVLFELDGPTKVLWLTRGRAATREEAARAIDLAAITLLVMTAGEGEAMRELESRLSAAREMLP